MTDSFSCKCLSIEKSKTLYTTQLVTLPHKLKKKLKCWLDDDTLKTQVTYQKLEEMRPLAQTTKSEVMDFVDVADQHTMGALSTHRKYDWTATEKLWEVTMIVVDC